MPQFARGYYGPNKALPAALTMDENTWRMIHREAVGNDRHVNATHHPDIRLGTATLRNGDANDLTQKLRVADMAESIPATQPGHFKKSTKSSLTLCYQVDDGKDVIAEQTETAQVYSTERTLLQRKLAAV